MQATLPLLMLGLPGCDSPPETLTIHLDLRPCWEHARTLPCGDAVEAGLEDGAIACLALVDENGRLYWQYLLLSEDEGTFRRTGGSPGLQLMPGDEVEVEFLLLRPGGVCSDAVRDCSGDCVISFGRQSLRVYGAGERDLVVGEDESTDCSLVACNTECVSEEDCDGEDNDCDGRTDEAEDLGPPPPGTCRSLGVCASGQEQCGPGGSWSCERPDEYESFELTCDGLDNDCDGRTDEGFLELGDICTTGLGECAARGVRV